MTKTRRFKALVGPMDHPQIVEKIAIYDKDNVRLDCSVIHKDDNGNEYYYVSNPYHKLGLFTDRPKDMIECIINDIGDAILSRSFLGISTNHVIRYIDRTQGEELRQLTIEGWKNVKFTIGVKFSFRNSMSSGMPICKDNTIMGYNDDFSSILTFDKEEEAQSYINLVVEAARKYYDEYKKLKDSKGTNDYDIYEKFFDKMKDELKIPGNLSTSVYWKVLSALDTEETTGEVDYVMKIIQLVVPPFEKEEEEKGWTITYVPWESDEGKPRVAGRFKTTAEKDAFLKKIYEPDSGWMEEEFCTIGIHNDYNYMLSK